MPHSNKTYYSINQIRSLEKAIKSAPCAVPAQMRCDLAALQLDLAANLIEVAAKGLEHVYYPSHTTELRIIAGRILRIKEKRTSDCAIDLGKNSHGSVTARMK